VIAAITSDTRVRGARIYVVEREDRTYTVR
jgi:hypothetical protein